MDSSFACFGSTCAVHADPDGARRARAQLLEWHNRFSRFNAASELSRLNRDPRPAVEVSPTMAKLVQAVIEAAEQTGGLVDGTLADEIEAAGYGADLGASLPLALSLRLAPPRRPAGPRPGARRRALRLEDGVLHRPPGVAIDGGGLAKGLFADLIAAELEGTFAVDCAGDVRLGGTPRAVHVASPFGGEPLHTFTLGDAGVATSGIGRRSWLGPDGRPAHHLLDPATGRPAYTGVVQATAIAATALEAEWRAKAAVLAGPERAGEWLPHGGAVVLDDGTHVVRTPEGDSPAAWTRR
ncbi:FAD:protein FMN transferase [Candidatus Solirubrobacter pratensis]|uniref:FAD:protein FMN transferase n=1 Tax=Candidatus Solirubrobacter pratensis TaxID=1298857 RepID=UPI00040F070F|nr:FAD:protein FMN transferase [Candidatus Solirubrobacter pratensis]